MNRKIEQKAATITPTGADEDFPGTFRVVLSTPGLDRDGESLKTDEWKQPLPSKITFDQDHGMSVSTTIGSGTPSIDKDGNLVVDGTFSSLPRAQEVRTLVKEGHIDKTSVAFITERTKGKDGVTSVKRELLNGAFVAIPANTEAVVLGAKSGARNNKNDAQTIQNIHDMASSLGASCGSKSAEGADTKAAGGFVPAPYQQDDDETVQCPECERYNDTDASFCDQCDADLTVVIPNYVPEAYHVDDDENVQCPSCNLMNDDDAHFCDQCGYKLEGNPNVVVKGLKAAETVSDKPWSQFSQSDYDIDQWRTACLIGPATESDSKSDYSLPVREPDGTLNRNACHAAAGALAGGRGGVDASDDDKKAAAKKLVALYHGPLKEDIPDSLAELAGVAKDSAKSFTPGVKAVGGSYEQRQQAISDALSNAYPGDDTWAYPIATFDDSVVYRVFGGGTATTGTWQSDYTIADDGTITLGDPARVNLVEQVMPVGKTALVALAMNYPDLSEEMREAVKTLTGVGEKLLGPSPDEKGMTSASGEEEGAAAAAAKSAAAAASTASPAATGDPAEPTEGDIADMLANLQVTYMKGLSQ